MPWGAVNIAFPFTMICMALFTLTSIGGVAVTAVRLGRGDEGAQPGLSALLCRHRSGYGGPFRRGGVPYRAGGPADGLG